MDTQRQSQLYFEWAKAAQDQRDYEDEERLWIVVGCVTEEEYYVGLCIGPLRHVGDVIDRANAHIGMRRPFIVAACRAVAHAEDVARGLLEQCTRISHRSPDPLSAWLGRYGTWFYTDGEGLDDLLAKLAAHDRHTLSVSVEDEVVDQFDNLVEVYSGKLRGAGVFDAYFNAYYEVRCELMKDMIHHFVAHLAHYEESQTRMGRDTPAAQ